MLLGVDEPDMERNTKFSTLDEFMYDAVWRMQNQDESFRTLDITNPVAENHLEGESSRFEDDIDESLDNEKVIDLLDTARTKGTLVNDVFLGFFQIDHEVSLALVQLFNDERRCWKRLAIQRCPGRALEACLALVATRGNLESLCLYQNNLGYTGFSCLAMILAANPSKLTILDIEDYISPNAADALAAGIKANKTLLTLDLHDCRFDRDALEYIAHGIRPHPKLYHLQLSSCQLTDMNAAVFVKSLLDHPSVGIIDLGLNYCSVKSMKALATAIRENRIPNLKSLSLIHQCTRLDPRLAIPLPIGILGGPLGTNHSLKELALSNNYLHPAELDLLMSGAKQSCLERLDLSRCGISDNGLQVILSNLPNSIKRLDITENLFASEESHYALICTVQFHTQLEMLDIDRDLECWQEVCYHARLNRGGTRILSSQVPLSLWPILLERINNIDWSVYDPVGEGDGFGEDVIFRILQGPAFCGR